MLQYWNDARKTFEGSYKGMQEYIAIKMHSNDKILWALVLFKNNNKNNYWINRYNMKYKNYSFKLICLCIEKVIANVKLPLSCEITFDWKSNFQSLYKLDTFWKQILRTYTQEKIQIAMNTRFKKLFQHENKNILTQLHLQSIR